MHFNTTTMVNPDFYFTYPFISFRIQGEHGEASDAEGAAQVSAGRLATFLTIS